MMSGTYLHRSWQGPTMPPGGEGGAAPPGAVRRGPLGAALRCHDRSLAGLHDACGRIVAFPQEDQRIHDGLWPDDTSRIRHHIAAVSVSH
jgi:hypothetical protein